MKDNHHKSAIIIGAGPAGLSCAYSLLKETDIKPIILEQTNRIGGISATINHNGNRMDLGGHRFFSKNKQINDLWTTFCPIQGKQSIDDKLLDVSKNLPAGGPDPQTNDRIMLLRRRVSRIFFQRQFFDYPLQPDFSVLRKIGFLPSINIIVGYITAMLFKRPETSLENFYINRFGKPLYEMFFESYTEKLWGLHPRNIAPDWGAQRVKGLSLLKTLLNCFTSSSQKETSLISEFLYPKHGPGSFYEALADEVVRLGGEIHFDKRVCRINHNSDKSAPTITSVVTVDTNGKEQTFTADYFVSSMPVKDLVFGFSEVPATLKQIASELPYRDFITVGVLCNRLKISNQTKLKTVGNVLPDCWIYIQEPDVKMGRLQIFNNWSPYLVKDWQNTVWVGLEYFCTKGDELWEKPQDKFISDAIDELVKIGLIEHSAVIDKCLFKFEKAYPAYFGSYGRFPLIREYLDRFQNLYCIGRNGQHRYNNMDHSMLTGIEATNVIKMSPTLTGAEIKSAKKTIWAVNTEEEYHEGGSRSHTYNKS